MRAVTITPEGDLQFLEHEDPKPGTGEVLVQIKGAGINGADILQRAGKYPPPPGAPKDIPGLELAGEVVELGAGAARFAIGDRVMGIVAGGGQAELAAVHERQLMPVPNAFDWSQAGGFAEVFVTANDAIFTQGELALGERLLVHGAAGGVGTAAVQLGVAAGAEVVASVRDTSKHDAVAELGATVVTPDQVESHGPYDVILELIGATNMPENVKTVAERGRIVVIGVSTGFKAEVNLLALMGKRAWVTGSTLRSRPLEQKAHATRLVEHSVLPLVERGSISVPIEATFSLAAAAEAYARFQAGGKLGKVVLVAE